MFTWNKQRALVVMKITICNGTKWAKPFEYVIVKQITFTHDNGWVAYAKSLHLHCGLFAMSFLG